MKKLFVCCLLLVAGCLSARTASAQAPLPGLEKVAAYSVYDPKGQWIVEGKNLDEARPLASLTKLVTAFVVLQHQPFWNKKVIMKKSDDIMGSSNFVRPGGVYTIRQLWQTGLVASANNAVKSLVRAIGLKEADVVAEMNEVARGLGLVNTKFVDVTGLSPGNVSTAREFNTLMSLAMSQKTISDTLKIKSFYIGSGKLRRLVKTTNSLLGQDFVRFGKTGFIDESGYNFGAALDNGGLKYQLLILGAPSRSESFTDARALARWVYGVGDYSQFISTATGPMTLLPSQKGGN